jgi:hypothetical protein
LASWGGAAPVSAAAAMPAMNKLRLATGFRVEDRSRGRYATPVDFPLHDTSTYRGLRVRRWGLGFVHRSRTIFCRAVPNLSVTVRDFCIPGKPTQPGFPSPRNQPAQHERAPRRRTDPASPARRSAACARTPPPPPAPPPRRSRAPPAPAAARRTRPRGAAMQKVANREIRVWHFVIEKGY